MKVIITEHDGDFVTELTPETDQDRRSITDMIKKCQFGEGLGSWSGSGDMVQLITKKDPK